MLQHHSSVSWVPLREAAGGAGACYVQLACSGASAASRSGCGDPGLWTSSPPAAEKKKVAAGLQGQAETHPFPATTATDITVPRRQPGCPVQGCTATLSRHPVDHAVVQDESLCAEPMEPNRRSGPQVCSVPFISCLGLHVPGLPHPCPACEHMPTQPAPSFLRRAGVGQTGRQTGGWVDGQTSPAGQSFPKAAQCAVRRSCPAWSRGCLTGGQAPPSKESIAFPSSAVKPEHNFPGCHSNSSGKAYYL